METTVKTETAQTVHIHHPTSSYGIFCFNSSGDLFVNSDWGMYGYAWRSYGPEQFKAFLAGTNAEYIVGKFSINHREVSGKKMPKHREENLMVLVTEFIKQLKNQTEPEDKPSYARINSIVEPGQCKYCGRKD